MYVFYESGHDRAYHAALNDDDIFQPDAVSLDITWLKVINVVDNKLHGKNLPEV